ncbi:MAG: MgtC/SapB family protein [Pseudomonadales bacterium]|nr:MgtC/SapB family protein [Pseudomonadales bacterium]
MESEQLQLLYNLTTALGIGVLIGLERGWKQRQAGDGERIAGVRTFALIGLLGGSSAILAEQLGPLVLSLVFLGLAGVWAAVYVSNLRNGSHDVGITSLVAGLLTFVLGALTALGDVMIAVAAAVVTTLLLSYKPRIHRWVGALDADELHAILKLLLISVVLLPILPDQGYGPWQALNPFTIWWMVVLIAAISFVGYFSIRIGGTRRGILFAGLFGGLASSTAVSLNFSRQVKHDRARAEVFAPGILLACGTMFPRMAIVATLINSRLLQPLLLPATLMTLVIALPILYRWRRLTSSTTPKLESVIDNPLEIGSALAFGALLGLVFLLSEALQQWVGETGLLALAAASGLSDVDAITLTLAQESQQDIQLEVAATGILIAATVNGLVKGGMAYLIGGRVLGVQVGVPLLLSGIVGLCSAWLWIY